MAVFRLQSNVPEIFVNKSRDFQLFCRLYDCVFDGVKVDIDSMLDILDARSCSNILLQLLQTKVGFFTNQKFTSDDLRIVIDAFPTIIKNKGSLKGVKQAINTFLKVKKLKTGAYINIVNFPEDGDNHNAPYTINVGIESDIVNTTLLDVLFYYVLPTGYDIYYYFYTESAKNEKFDFVDSKYKLVFSNPYVTSSLDIEPETIFRNTLPVADEDTLGKIYVIPNGEESSTSSKWYSDMDDSGNYIWKEVTSDNYKEIAMLGVTELSKYYSLTDTSNPDTYKILDIPDINAYRKSDAVCGYYYNGNFYSDSSHNNMITPIGESNKLCYYDIKNRNFYVYTSSYNAYGDTTPKYVLIVHEENIDNA